MGKRNILSLKATNAKVALENLQPVIKIMMGHWYRPNVLQYSVGYCLWRLYSVFWWYVGIY